MAISELGRRYREGGHEMPECTPTGSDMDNGRVEPDAACFTGISRIPANNKDPAAPR